MELRIDAPDASGVGEVLARGPNVMMGYWRAGAGAPEVDEALTAEVLEDGWLRTGDLGRLDAEGRLTLCGRKKDLILSADGHNVYPDDVEELYRSDDLVKELSVVGLPDPVAEGGERAERVAMLVVPAWHGRDPATVQRLLEAHVREVSARLPLHQRVKVWHVTDAELPRTSTRKVKRDWVAGELARLEAEARRGARLREGGREARGDAWLLDLLAEVARRPRSELAPVHAARRPGLRLAHADGAGRGAGGGGRAGRGDRAPPVLRDGGGTGPRGGERSRRAGAARRRAGEPGRRGPPARRELMVPASLAAVGRTLLGLGQRALYRDVYATAVHGKAFVPHDRNFLVVANHQSHLDMGLVKVALGEEGQKLVALAAADYFFDTPLKRAYFENFTNLIPLDRAGSVRRSLRAAVAALRQGQHLLIFPEGTRSRGGEMAAFKPTAGYLALHCGVDTLPVYLYGTHEALPPGGLLPRTAKLEVRIGQPVLVEELRAADGVPPQGRGAQGGDPDRRGRGARPGGAAGRPRARGRRRGGRRGRGGTDVRLLVTGGTGFLGSALVPLLAGAGHEVRRAGPRRGRRRARAGGRAGARLAGGPGGGPRRRWRGWRPSSTWRGRSPSTRATRRRSTGSTCSARGRCWRRRTPPA